MNISKIKLIGAALFFASSTVFAAPSYYAVNDISDASTLTLRAWPSVKSRPINSIPHNAVRLEATGKHIFKENKKWLQIKYQNNTGWAEADYLAEMQATTEQPAAAITMQQNETLNESTSFSYSPQTTAVSTQPTPEGVPWTTAQDTIYHDPTVKQLSGINPIERVEATHTLVVIQKGQDDADYRGENVAGNRYESIQASMSVQYQP